ncbi:MAG: hypothetical protein PHN74_01250 [Candidatus Pacebacteria bacterium]|nr:hypothetical protein [Candidatus Paceibacterota bacterium]
MLKAAKVLAVALVLIAAILQNTYLVEFYGIKPNFVLAVLLALVVFVDNFWNYLILSFLGVIILKFNPAINKESLLMLFLPILAFYSKKIMIRRSLLNIVLLIGVFTLIFYLVADASFIVKTPFLFILETIYNIFIGSAVYLIADFIYEKTKFLQRRFSSRGDNF